jgi:hydrogenase maturation protease
VVIGIGNLYRHDEGIGPVVLSRLRHAHLPGVTLADSDGEPTRLLDLWAGARLAIVVHAVHTAAPKPGRIHRLSLHHPSGPAGARGSAASDLGAAVALGAALNLLPRTLLLYAVEAADTGLGIGLSAPVREALEEVVHELVDGLTGRQVSFGPSSGGPAAPAGGPSPGL